MKIGIKLPVMSPASGDELRRFIEAVDAEGFDSIWVGDHIVIPATLKRANYPYLWRFDASIDDLFPEKYFLEAMTACAFVAGVSQRLQIGVGVLVLPMRRVVETAKEIATLDVLSGGRFIAGIGTGWLREEFEALNAPFDDRGKRLDEYVMVMRKLWSGGRSSHHSELADFDDLYCRPAPVQAGGPPIWVGGQSRRALRRVVELGDGWQAVELPPTEYAEASGVLDDMLEKAGRDPRSVTRSVSTRLRLGGPDASEAAGQVRAFAAAGCEHFIVYSTPSRSVNENIERAKRLMDIANKVAVLS